MVITCGTFGGFKRFSTGMPVAGLAKEIPAEIHAFGQQVGALVARLRITTLGKTDLLLIEDGAFGRTEPH